jgi:hypothetical protein
MLQGLLPEKGNHPYIFKSDATLKRKTFVNAGLSILDYIISTMTFLLKVR